MELLLGLFEFGLFQVRVKFTVFTQLKKGVKKLLSALKCLVFTASYLRNDEHFKHNLPPSTQIWSSC